MKKQEECEHEYEFNKSGYSYDQESGSVYKFEKTKCKKCGKVKIHKLFDL
jgi:hypothetical protein